MMWFQPASYRASLLDRGKSMDYINRVMVPTRSGDHHLVCPDPSILGSGLGWGSIETSFFQVYGQNDGDKDAQ